jgi:CheY-like chemotaxis protein
LARKILLADDSVTAQNMGRKILADAGYEVVTVNNGSAALKKVADSKPDLIVLDVYMPGYSGLEVCQRLKEASETARIPILLTVGKLEPFKPEEAKRSRADGYIVKPFEASELLSALTKLEEKIVPRAESSKPGRFARNIAAVEEGRYDRSMSVEEDTSWKDRIMVPGSKKKKAPEPQEEEDPGIYNPVNRDLRTVVDHRGEHPPQAARPQESKLDLGALAPEGLPKDVTAEEIAALAAAAAQIKGSLDPGQDTSATPHLPEPVAASVAQGKAEAPVAERHAEEVKAEVRGQAKSEDKADAKVEAPPVEANVVEVPEVRDSATKAEEKTEAAVEAKDEGKSSPAESSQQDAEKDSKADAPSTFGLPHEAAAEFSVTTPSAAEVTATLAALEPASETSTANSGPAAPAFADEPVTMAAAAGGTTSRWTAVAVALPPEEAAISLEQEMQQEMQKVQAYAAASEAAPPAPVEAESAPAAALTASAPDSAPAFNASDNSVATASAAAKGQESASTESQPEIASASAKPFEVVEQRSEESREIPTAEAKAAEGTTDARAQEEVKTEAVPSAVAETSAESASHSEAASESRTSESVSDSKVSEPSAEDSTPEPIATAPKPEAPEPAAAFQPEPPAPAAPELPAPVQETPSWQATSDETEPAEVKPGDAIAEAAVTAASAEASSKSESFSASLPESESAREESALAASAQHDGAAKDLAPEAVAKDESLGHDRREKRSAREASSDAHRHPESDITATTAAAWASWRKVRESGDGHPGPHSATQSEKSENPPADSKSEAAMAVAAGAEKSPAEASPNPESEEPAEIETIVDSVLADLRPRIVAEISKKMGKKK